MDYAWEYCTHYFTIWWERSYVIRNTRQQTFGSIMAVVAAMGVIVLRIGRVFRLMGELIDYGIMMMGRE